MPRRRGSSFGLGGALLVVLAALILFAPIKGPLSRYDEGAAVLAGVRAMGGELPYRDFWLPYPPGQTQVLAFLFRFFGVGLLPARVYDTLVRLSIVLLVYALTRKLSSSKAALAAGLVAAVILGSAGGYSYAMFPALALGLASVVASLDDAGTARRSRLVLSGVLGGAAMYFRWDVGLYGLLTVAFAASLRWYQQRPRRTRLWTQLKLASQDIIVPVLGGALAAVAVLYGSMLMRGAAGALWKQAVVFPIRGLPAVRWKPYPPFVPAVFPGGSIPSVRHVYSELTSWLRFYMPPIIYIAVLGRSLSALIAGRKEVDERTYGVVAAAGFGGLLFIQALSRYDYIHVVPTLLLASSVAIAWLWPNARRMSRVGVRILRPLLLILLIPIVLLSPLKTVAHIARQYPVWGRFSNVPRASGVSIDADQERAIDFVQAHVQPDEPIYVGTLAHDRGSISDASFYFLCERPCPTFYGQLHPGITSTAPVQQHMRDEIASSDVQWIVLVRMPDLMEPNQSSVSSGVDVLDAFIRSNYRGVGEFGSYKVLKRVAEGTQHESQGVNVGTQRTD